MKSCMFAICLFSLGLALPGQATAAEWGNLTGQFLYDGTAPTPQPLTITKDQEVCGKYQDEIFDQSLLVDENGGIEGIFVWLRPKPGTRVEVHPDLEKTMESTPAVMDNVHCMFYPHTMGVWAKKQTLVCKNSDPIAQVVKIDFIRNASVNATMAIGGKFDVKFPTGERLPAAVTCGLHPWESGFLLVSDTPYFATTDKTGSFTIPNLPTGEWEFQVWQERCGYLAARPEWKSGRVTLRIKPGDNPLGTIKVDAKLLAKK